MELISGDRPPVRSVTRLLPDFGSTSCFDFSSRSCQFLVRFAPLLSLLNLVQTDEELLPMFINFFFARPITGRFVLCKCQVCPGKGQTTHGTTRTLPVFSTDAMAPHGPCHCAGQRKPKKMFGRAAAIILILFKLEREQEGGRSSMSRCADCRQDRRESLPVAAGPSLNDPCELGSVQEAARDRLVKPFKLPGW